MNSIQKYSKVLECSLYSTSQKRDSNIVLFRSINAIYCKFALVPGIVPFHFVPFSFVYVALQ